MFSTTTMASSTTRPTDRTIQHDGQQREQIDGEAEDLHQQHGADEGDRNGDDGDDHAAHGAEEEEDDDHYDE
jgi:hypothetical protein